GGLEVAINSVLKRHQGVWFGWSGKISPRRSPAESRRIEHDNVSYIVTDLYADEFREFYNGVANRVLWPILHYRLDLAEFSRRDLSGYLRVHAHFGIHVADLVAAHDGDWVHD